MASPFADALMQSMVSGFDPMNGVIRQVATQHVSRGDVEIDELKLDMMDRIQARIETLTADGKTPDAAVLASYQKMLGKYAK